MRRSSRATDPGTGSTVDGGPGHGNSMPTPPARSRRKGDGRVRLLKAPATFRRSGYRVAVRLQYSGFSGVMVSAFYLQIGG